MNPEALLNVIIKKIQGIEMTSVSAFFLVFAFIFILIAYHWSGLSEKVENLTIGKKIIIFSFIALIIIIFYYAFYKAGKFDKFLSFPIVSDTINKITSLISRYLRT
jgi:hypothetical protein